MVRKVAFLFLLLSASAQAETSILLHVSSKHYSAQNAREENPGVGVVSSRGGWMVAAGIYDNSMRRRTVYVAAGREIRPSDWFTLRAGVTLASGYEWLPDVGMVAVIPTVQARIGYASLTVLPAAVGFGFELPIDW